MNNNIHATDHKLYCIYCKAELTVTDMAENYHISCAEEFANHTQILSIEGLLPDEKNTFELLLLCFYNIDRLNGDNETERPYNIVINNGKIVEITLENILLSQLILPDTKNNLLRLINTLEEMKLLSITENHYKILPSWVEDLRTENGLRMEIPNNTHIIIESEINSLISYFSGWTFYDPNEIDYISEDVESPTDGFKIQDNRVVGFIETGEYTQDDIIQKLCAFSYLQFIKIANTDFIEIPQSLMNLNKLKILDLNGSSFDVLPTWIVDHPTLEFVSLTGYKNRLCPKKLKYLNKIQLPSNVIVIGDEVYVELMNIYLKIIEHSDFLNFIFEQDQDEIIIDNGIFILRNGLLREIHFKGWDGHHDLSEHINYLKDCKSLEVLDISNNYFDRLPDGINELKGLKKLIARNCYITKLPKWLKKLPNLELLDLRENKPSCVPVWIKTTNIKEILADSYASDEEIEILEEIIKSIDYSPDEFRQILSDEDQKFGYFIENDRVIGLKISGVEYQDVFKEYIKEIKELIQRLPNLTLLDFSDNKLLRVPRILTEFPKVKKIVLRDNYIFNIEDIEILVNKYKDVHISLKLDKEEKFEDLDEFKILKYLMNEENDY